MKTSKKLSLLLLIPAMICSAFSVEGDNPPPTIEPPFSVLPENDATVPLAVFFVKIVPAIESAPHDYSVSLDLSKIYEKSAFHSYELAVGDRLTVKIDFAAYPNSKFIKIARSYDYTPVFVNRNLPKQGWWWKNSWQADWRNNNPGKCAIFGHIENQGWSSWWNSSTLVKIAEQSEQDPAYVTYEAMAAGEVAFCYSYKLLKLGPLGVARSK
ncbi:MAG: hypothetical protein K2W99_00250 [Chthoniobacterales bacterium]|nr:hypothetical protein [Chthoniobacterales bacterium]